MDRVTGETLLIEATPDIREIHTIFMRPIRIVLSPGQTYIKIVSVTYIVIH